MTIRPIKPEEKIMKSKIQSIAFMFSQDFSTAAKNPEEFQKDYETGRGAFDENGKMCSCLDLIPYTVQYDGKSVTMGGIGGVASLPEEREKRYIRHIFESIMNEMYDRGDVFSYLYPFSFIYYRKFGYELNMRLRIYTFPVSSLKQFKQIGSVRLFQEDRDRTEIESVYAAFIANKNLAVNRTDKLWNKFLEKDPYKDTVYLYLWYNAEKKLKGYIQYRVERIPGAKSNLHVQEFIWLDNEAFRGLLSFMGGLTAQAEKMIWRAPDFVDLLPVFQDPYEVKQEIITFGMNRIVNVSKAFEGMLTPDGSGEVTVGVKDEFFSRNSGNYTLSWENGRHEISLNKKSPDLTCDIQALTQLITGFTTPDLLRFAGRIDLTGKEESLKKLFKPKELYINDYF